MYYVKTFWGMKKTIKESIEWHSVETKYPITNELVLAQSNDGILRAYWDKQKQRWCTIDDGSAWGRTLNSDTHVYYWAYYPKGVNVI